MKWTCPVLVVAISVGLFSQSSMAASIKELLENAFDSQTGNVLAPIDGQVTDMIRRTAPVRGDIMASVKTLKHFEEKDCRRFSIELKAEFAPESGAKGPVPLPKMELNYCKGGSFPQEGVDPEAGKKFTEQVDRYEQQRGENAPTPKAQKEKVLLDKSVLDQSAAENEAIAAKAVNADPSARPRRTKQQRRQQQP